MKEKDKIVAANRFWFWSMLTATAVFIWIAVEGLLYKTSLHPWLRAALVIVWLVLSWGTYWSKVKKPKIGR